jgi:hypothetical protein
VTLADPLSAAGDFYGYGVAIAGSTIIVGAENSTVGSAYFYVKGASGWPTVPTTTVMDPAGKNGDCFGLSVAASGSNAIIGAGCNRPPAGKAYIYTKGPAGWSKKPVATLHPGLPAGPNDYFGSMVAISGSVASVGAWGTANPAGRTRAGAVYLYRKAAGGWPQTSTVTLGESGRDVSGLLRLQHLHVSGRRFRGGVRDAPAERPDGGSRLLLPSLSDAEAEPEAPVGANRSAAMGRPLRAGPHIPGRRPRAVSGRSIIVDNRLLSRSARR